MIDKQRIASGAAVGAIALLLASAGGYWAASAQAPYEHSVNPPESAAPAPGAPVSFADIVEKVAPAVVSIDVVEKTGPTPLALGPGDVPFGFQGPGGQGGPFMFRFGPGAPGQNLPPKRASGSGFFISADGYVVTNNHVVDGAEKITVHTADDRRLTATVVGRDPATDLAVLKVEGGPFQYVSFENRAKPRVGDWVVAVGNPFGLGGTATAGIVSALGRENVSGSSYVDFMQIDAPINRGNSGGPTFDVEGRVVGINTAIFSPSGGSVGIGFDIPADVAASVTRQLIENGKVTRGYIGATIQSLTPDLADSLGLKSTKGAIVDQLTAGGPAEQAGLKSGDIVVGVGGHDVQSAADLTRQVALAHPGEAIDLDIQRGGETRHVVIRSGLRPSEASLASNGNQPGGAGDAAAGPAVLGLQLAPDAHGGLVVRGVDPNSDAAQKGLRPGDVVLRAGVTPVQSAADLAQAAAAARHDGRKSVPLLIARGNQHIYVPVQVEGEKG